VTPPVFLQRVRKRLKKKGMRFALLHKSAKECKRTTQQRGKSGMEVERIWCGDGERGRAEMERWDAGRSTTDDHEAL
jgi:hypothetical protein